MGKQKVTILLPILVRRIWFQNHLKALSVGYKMVLEATKTDQYEQSYGQMNLTIIFIVNRYPRKLFSFLAPLFNLDLVSVMWLEG